MRFDPDLIPLIRDSRNKRKITKNCKKRWNVKESKVRMEHTQFRFGQKLQALKNSKSAKQLREEQDQHESIQEAYKKKLAVRDLEFLKNQISHFEEVTIRDKPRRAMGLIEDFDQRKRLLNYLLAAF